MGRGTREQLPIYEAIQTLQDWYPEDGVKSRLPPPRWGLFKDPRSRAYLLLGRVSFSILSTLLITSQYWLYTFSLPIGLLFHFCFPQKYDFPPLLRRSQFRDVTLAVGLPLTMMLHKYTPRRSLRLLWDIFWCHYFIFGSSGEENSRFFNHELFLAWKNYLASKSAKEPAEIPFFIIAFDNELIENVYCSEEWSDKEFLEHILGVYRFFKLERGLLSSLSLQRLGRIEVAEVSLPFSPTPIDCWDCLYCLRS